MAQSYGIVQKGGSLSQTLKDAGYSRDIYTSSAIWKQVGAANKLDSRYTVQPNQRLDFSMLSGGSAPAPATKTAVAPVASAPVSPSNAKEMADYLNQSQAELDAIKDYDPFSGQASGEAVSGFLTGDTLGMEGEMPLAPKYAETFEKLRVDMGLDTIESSINDYKQMIRDQENLLLQQRGTERGKAVRLGVMEGRIDKATTDRQEQISWLSSNVSYLTDVANSAYNFISMTMNFKQMDYNTAKEAYDSEFTKRMAVYDSLVETARDERDFKLALRQEQQKVASVQVSMYADMISTGQMQWSDLSNTEQLAIHKLEVQAGLPTGFIGKIKIPKGSTIQSITNRQDASGRMVADIIYVDPITGAVSVEHQDLGSVYRAPKATPKPSQTTTDRTSKSAMSSQIISDANANGGTLTTDQWNYYRTTWGSAFDVADFDDMYSEYYPVAEKTTTTSSSSSSSVTSGGSSKNIFEKAGDWISSTWKSIFG